MKKTILIIFVVIIGIIGAVIRYYNYYESNQALDKDLLLADSLMFIKPDSSLAIIERISNKNFSDKKNNALKALLTVQARSRNYITAESDSLIKIALKYYSTSTDSTRKAWTYLYAADVYEDMGRRSDALSYIQKAADNLVDNNLLRCYLYFNWGWILQGDKPYDEAINKFTESEKYARKLNDTTLIVTRLMTKCRSNMYKKENDKSLDLINDAISLAEQAKLYKYIPLFYLRKSHILLNKEQYQESLVYASKAVDNIAHTDDSLKIYSFKAHVLIKMNDLDSVRYYIEKGKTNKNFFTRSNYHDLMSLLEEAKGNYNSALKYRAEFANLRDSIYIEEENRKVMELQNKYDFSIVKAENDELKIENQLKDIYLLIFVIILLCIAFAVYLYINHLHKKANGIIVAKEQLSSQTINSVQKKNNELMMKLQEFQEKELAMLSNITDKDNELNELQEEQRNLKESIFKMNDVVKKIEKIKSIPVKQRISAPASLMLSSQELDNLIDSINLCYDGFADRLIGKHPDISKDDVYLCCLLRIGVTNQNIIILLNTTDTALKKRKYRLKNDKLNLDEDTKTLEMYLESM